MKIQHIFSVVSVVAYLSGFLIPTGIASAAPRVATITPSIINTQLPVTSTNTPTRTFTRSLTPVPYDPSTNTPSRTATGTITQTPSITLTPSATKTFLPTPTLLLPTAARVQRVDGGSVTTTTGYYPYRLAQIPEQGNSDVVQIVLGPHHALGVKRSGMVFGWGTNIKGELYVPAAAQSNVVQVAVGKDFSVALKNTGAVVFWGDKSVIPSSTDTSVPTDVVMIAAGDQHTLLLRANGTVVVVGATAQKAIPPALSTKTVVSIAAGASSSMALTSDGMTYIWGRVQTIPSLAGTSIRKIWASGQLFAALRRDGRVVVFGSASALNAGSFVESEPGCPCAVIGGMTNLVEFQVARWGALLRTQNTATYAYSYRNLSAGPPTIPDYTKGIAYHPNLANGLLIVEDIGMVTPTASLTPTPEVLLGIRSAQEKKLTGRVWPIGGGNSLLRFPENMSCDIYTCAQLARQVVAGPDYAAILKDDHSVLAWPQPGTTYRFGQMTIPTSLQSPFAANDPLRVVALAAGGTHMLALRANGTVVAWGNNAYGQTTIPAGLSGVVHIAAGARHSVALLNTGRVVAWGDNSSGQLNVPNTANVVNVSAGAFHTIALRSNGTVFGWGQNLDGQLNLPSTANFVDIGANDGNSVLLASNGTVSVYGDAQYGQTTVPDGQYTQIAAGGKTIIAVNNAGYPVGWGLSVADNINFRFGWGLAASDEAEYWYSFSSMTVPPAISGMALGNNFSIVLWDSNHYNGGALWFAATRTPTRTNFPTPTPTRTLVVPTAQPFVARSITYEISNVLTQSEGARSFVARGQGSLRASVDDTGRMTLEGDAQCDWGQICGPSPFVFETWGGTFMCTPPDSWYGNVKEVKFSQTAGFMLKRDHSLWVWDTCPYTYNTLHQNSAPRHIIPTEFLNNVKAFEVDQTPKIDYFGSATEINMIILRHDNALWSNKCVLPTFTKTIRDVAVTDTLCAVLFEDGSVWTNDPSIAVPASYPPLVDIGLGARSAHDSNFTLVTDYVYGLGVTQSGEVVGWGTSKKPDEVLDIPIDARSKVIEITVSQTQNIALRSDGRVVIWGSPYGTGSSPLLDTINNQSGASWVNIGYGGSIQVLADDPVQVFPTATLGLGVTPTTIPRGTSVRVNDNLVGAYTFDSVPQMTQFQFTRTNGVTAGCRNPFCPEVVYERDQFGSIPFLVLKFREAKGDELTSTEPVNLSGNFTIAVQMLRDRPYHHDVGVSAGLPGQVRRYLVIGVDRENRPYCSFYGDDLRGSPLTLAREANMHSYSCSYNSTTRERVLMRDGQVIAKDIVTGGFSAPNSPLVIGRRADTMAGLDGLIASVRYWPSVVQTNNQITDPLMPAAIQFPGILPGQQPVVCSTKDACPNIVPEADDAHDGGYVNFARGNGLSLAMPANTNAFTLSLWMNIVENDVTFTQLNGLIASRYNADNSGFEMRMHEGNMLCGRKAASAGPTEYDAAAILGNFDITPGWHMYSCVVKPDSIAIAKDGEVVYEVGAIPWSYGPSLVIGQVPGMSAPDCTYFSLCHWLTYPIDDVYVYQEALSPQKLAALYRETARLVPLPTETPDPLRSATPTQIRTATATFSPTPSHFTRTRIPATLTITVPPTQTRTRTFTLTRTSTVTRTFTRTTTPSPTITPTRPTSTVFLSPTRSMTRTRTALAITRTWMARRSPTFAVQTMTAVARSANQTATALRLTQTAIIVGTPTNTATAYPLPATVTPEPTGYPTP
jgi:alpha-tubulin suppressor-like RCC1 family protein